MSRTTDSTRRSRSSRNGIWLLTLFSALLLSTGGAYASSGLLTGSLGRWLDTEATPKLAELLSRHPKFSGEAINIVSLEDGKPVEAASRLHQAIQSHLTQRLRKYPGVRLAWGEPSTSCGVPQNLSYLLGIEIATAGGQNQSLSIGMIDVAEAVWVSGVSLSWRGRLSSAEKIALRSPVVTKPTGTIDSPLPISATEEIAALLKKNVQCALPDGLNGSIYIEPADTAALNRVRGQLQRELSLIATAALATSKQDAAWTIKVTASSIGGQTQEIVLTLADSDGNSNQHLASVFVSGASNGPVIREGTLLASAPVELLSPMRLKTQATGGVCDSHRSSPEPCVEVTFDLARTAYLFVLSTSDRELHTTSCSTSARQVEAGTRKFRLRVPVSQKPGTADAGVYAIAIEDRRAARAIARHIRKAPGTCARHSNRGMTTWLNQFDELLGRYPDSYEWRAVHLDTVAGELTQL